MKKIDPKKKYEEASIRMEGLLRKTEGIDTMDDADMILLDHYSTIVADYEEQKFPIEKPSLADVVKLRMYEMGLKQTDLAQLLDIPTSRISEYLRGKRDITLGVARKLHKNLNIDGDIILQ